MGDLMIEVGAPCPEFEAQAAVSGRRLTQAEAAQGRRVLVFHGPKTTDAPKTVGKAVRAKWPTADEVEVWNIIDLRKMGGMWQKVANAQIKATYGKLASKVDGDPERLIVMCPDWDGAVAAAFGIEMPDVQAAVVGLRDGKVVAVAEGEGLVAAATS